MSFFEEHSKRLLLILVIVTLILFCFSNVDAIPIKNQVMTCAPYVYCAETDKEKSCVAQGDFADRFTVARITSNGIDAGLYPVIHAYRFSSGQRIGCKYQKATPGRIQSVWMAIKYDSRFVYVPDFDNRGNWTYELAAACPIPSGDLRKCLIKVKLKGEK